MTNTFINPNSYIELSNYIVKHYKNKELLFNAHPYKQNSQYQIILGLHIYSSLDTLSARITDLDDNNLSRLWCINYNPEYQNDPTYNNYKASLYVYKLVYRLSYDTELDFYIDEYTKLLRIVPFENVYKISETQKVCVTTNGLILYDLSESTGTNNIVCNLNISDICKLALYKANKELLNLLFDSMNTPRKLALISNIKSLFNDSDSISLKKSILGSYAYLQHITYKDTDINTALVLELSFEKTVDILASLNIPMKKSRTKLPIF